MMIFDFGFYNGLDAIDYIKKGFNVVALEANPIMTKKGMEKFKKYIEEGKLMLINKAIFDKVGTMDFYVNDIYSSWKKWIAEYNGVEAKLITVETTTLTELCKEYGIPYYIKVDIEGCGVHVARHLFTLEKKPQFMSFETRWENFGEVFAWLLVSGYKKFQLINQLNYKDNSSGLFGEDLPDNWYPYEDLLERYMKFRDLRIIRRSFDAIAIENSSRSLYISSTFNKSGGATAMW